MEQRESEIDDPKAEPLTWDGQGRLVPLDDEQATRQGAILRDQNGGQPEAPDPHIMTAMEMKRERCARLVLACQNRLELRQFDFPGMRVYGPRTAIVAVCMFLVAVPVGLLAILGATALLPVARARLKKIDRQLTADQRASDPSTGNPSPLDATHGEG